METQKKYLSPEVFVLSVDPESDVLSTSVGFDAGDNWASDIFF